MSGFKASMIRMFGEEEVKEAENHAADQSYKVYLERMKIDFEANALPPELMEAVDFERESFLCAYDKQVMSKIKDSVQECNRLIYYEL
jgi:hypothetical protein